jgi:hypothetical protein
MRQRSDLASRKKRQGTKSTYKGTHHTNKPQQAIQDVHSKSSEI